MIFTKIVATIGPTSDDVKTIRSMYNAGMRVARLNFSHGAYDYFEKVIANIREVSDEIAILLDTKGPEIRSGVLENGYVDLEDKDEILLTSEEVIGNREKITINYHGLHKLKKGDKILIDDGLIESEVIEVIGKDVKVKVLNGGRLGSKKTVSLRGHNAEIPFLSEKDKEDIEFGIANNFDFIAASFVRKASEVKQLRKYLEEKNSKIRVISKIEHWEALNNINEIIEVSQGIMVARGDLGVEVPLEKVPMIQKDIIKRCNELGKPVIVATQMLESMKENPRPTRAEVADVAQAIVDGADAVMLSGETASGKYPVRAVKMMESIAKEYDKNAINNVTDSLHTEEEIAKNSISMFVTKSAYNASQELGTKAILIPTESGYTARKVSRFKPKCVIYAITHDMTVFRQLQLSWGVVPVLEEKYYENLDDMINTTVKNFYEKKYLHKEDRFVITGGHIMSRPGHTNILEIYRVKHILERLNMN